MQHGKEEPEERKTLKREAKHFKRKGEMEMKVRVIMMMMMMMMTSIRTLISNYSKGDFVVRYMLKKTFSICYTNMATRFKTSVDFYMLKDKIKYFSHCVHSSLYELRENIIDFIAFVVVHPSCAICTITRLSIFSAFPNFVKFCKNLSS